jgi:phosphoketolase
MIIQGTGVVTSPMCVTQSTEEMETLALYQCATNYLGTAQIYLQSKFLLWEPLRKEEIHE